MTEPKIFVAGAELGVAARRRASNGGANDNRRAPRPGGAEVRDFPQLGVEPIATYRGLECAAVGDGVVVIEIIVARDAWP